MYAQIFLEANKGSAPLLKNATPKSLLNMEIGAAVVE